MYPSNDGPALDDDEAFDSTSEELRQFVERIEQIESEIKELQDNRKDIYKEAKAFGFDAKALKAVIQRRKKDADEIAEFEAILETYLSALGMT